MKGFDFMIKLFINSYKELDNKILNIMKKGFKFSFAICMISVLLLLTYLFINANIYIYQIGIMLFQLALFYGISFIICGIVVDGIKKNNI